MRTLFPNASTEGDETDQRLSLSGLEFDQRHLGRLPEPEEAAGIELLPDVVPKGLQVQNDPFAGLK